MGLKSQNIGALQLALAGVGSGTIPIFSTLLLRHNTPVLMQILFRLGVTAIILAIPVGFYISRKKWLIKGQIVPYMAINGLLIFGAFFTYLSSIAMGTPIVKAVLLSYTYPIFAAVLSFIILKERIDKSRALSILLAVGGVAIVMECWSISSGIGMGIGELLAIANGLVYAGVIVLERYIQKSNRELHPISFTFFSFVFALPWLGIAISLLIFYPVNSLSIGEFSNLQGISIVYLLCLALISTLLPYSLLNFGLQRIDATVASIFLLFEPISVFVLGKVILGQSIGLWQIVGGICILSGAVVCSRESQKAHYQQP